MLIICGNYLSLWLGVNGNMRVLASLLCALPPFPMVYTLNLHVWINLGIPFILLLCALIVNLLTIVQILVSIMIFLMNDKLESMP